MASNEKLPSESQERLLHLIAAVWFGGAEALKNLLATQDPKKRDADLKKKSFTNKKGKWVLGNYQLRDDQYDLLFPASGDIDIAKLDITLLRLVLLNLSNFPRTQSSFDIDKFPPTGSISQGDYVFFMKEIRNNLAHWGSDEITKEEFEKYWQALLIILKGLGYDVSNVTSLKSGPLTQECAYLKGTYLYKLDRLRISVDELADKCGLQSAEYVDMSQKLDLLTAKISELERMTTTELSNCISSIKDAANEAIVLAKKAFADSQYAKVTSEEAKAIAATTEAKLEKELQNIRQDFEIANKRNAHAIEGMNDPSQSELNSSRITEN